jgi:hypothetical protein
MTRTVSRSDEDAISSADSMGDRGLDHGPDGGVVGRAGLLEPGLDGCDVGDRADLRHDDGGGTGRSRGGQVVGVPRRLEGR